MARRSIVQVYFIFTLCGTGGSVQYENCTDGDIGKIGSGYCTVENNHEGCMYDGGDCCQCTSIDDGIPSSDTSSSYFLCVDPSSPCYSPIAVALQSNCTDGDVINVGDGWCDDENNNKGCVYDGGDCCECTSIDDGYSSSDTSSSYFLCVDPSSPCYSPIAVDLQSNCTDGDIANIKNGRCDHETNNEGCLYDGGDCCNCISIEEGSSPSDTSSSYFFCVDPSSSCYSPTAVDIQLNCINGTIDWIQDGWCDDENNNEDCLYDGGDCCECTGIEDGYSASDISSPYFLCVDPSSPCYSPIAAYLQPNCTDGDVKYVGDGRCDDENNNEDCLYDGGDCCNCTSIDDGYPSSAINSLYFFCVDPSSPCYSPNAVYLQSNCTDGDVIDVGDGRCDDENNNEGCLYDGGDCCNCTSIDDGGFSSAISSSYVFCVDPSSPCYSPIAVDLQSNCTDGYVKYVGDGWCDDENNNEGCLYDGGDCCNCASIDDGYPSSAINSLNIFCVDPISPCFSPNAIYLQSNCTDGDVVNVGNGRCDVENNNEDCLYDGGDCCECTSIGDGYSSFDISSPYFLCVDPSSPCFSPIAVDLQSNCTDGYVKYVGDGWCDDENNNEGCLYDGGDCCECTSIDDGYSASDISSPYFLCVDPSSPCFSPIAVDLQSNCTDGYVKYVGDGWCDDENNNEGCLYDGGDCCECTSIDDGSFSSAISSSYFFCVDPSSPCYSPIEAYLQSNCTDGDVKSVGDGRCDDENNNEDCLYDGGDCCECSSIDDGYSSSDTSSSYFLCVDPSSPCYSPIEAYLQSNCTDGDVKAVGDGWCDDENNNEDCLYDGGDCCECSSIDDGYSSSDTSSSYFLCVDPSSPCYSPIAVDLQSNCTNGDIADIGDGRCDEENNNGGCLFDGGDCCSCTCVYECGFYGFKCLDPKVADLEPYICDTSQHTLTSCAGVQREWIVENASHVRALVEAIRCSGGSFNVTWMGKVSVEKTISIFDGTILNVTSINSDSVIDGDGKTRLFSVVNASLHLSNITVSNGNAAYGGAIAASRSRATFTMVSFIGNTVTNNGGALHLSNGTSVSFVGETSFLNNTASNGGALCVMDGSNASWTRNTSFSYNVATSNGGALYLMDHSSAVWKAKANFLHNSAGDDGGALNLRGSSRAYWTAEAHFLNNSAGSDGGALYLMDQSSAVWKAKAHFLRNSAEVDGGALNLRGSSRADWTAEAHFLNNSAGSFGGALYLWSSSVADWTGEAQFLSNSARSIGGALYLMTSSRASWNAEVHFLHNTVGSSGGALYLRSGSRATWNAEVYILHNSAGSSGGALYLQSGSRATWNAEVYILYNSAGSSGGALYLILSSTIWKAKAHFLHNSAIISFGGALYLSESSADWTGEAQFLSNSARSNGGALYLAGSSATWTEEAHFLSNSAISSGGALYLKNSSASWTKEAHFHSNSAGSSGGALYLTDSSANWTKEAHFHSNSAEDDGGALYVTDGSYTSWEGNTLSSKNASTGGIGGALYVSGISSANWTAVSIFSGNNALSNGGGVYADDGASLSWTVKTLFVDNDAKNGGALFLTNGVNTQWSEETNFTSNYARLDGGAVGHFSANNERSVITLNGTTSFVNNKCGRNGGGMSLVQSVAIVLGTTDTTFWKNCAGASGGAIYTAFNGIGIVFMEVAFVENFAQIGGGVHSTESGTEVIVDKNKTQMNNPMTFDRCKFVGNYAFATGGAVDSAAGQDVFIRTSFEGNRARVGGALRLAGIASVDSCSFEENVSEFGGGPAVSNSGHMSNVGKSYFGHNVFKCKAQKFLHFEELDDPFETVCDGCPSSCFECSFGEGYGSPTCISLSEAGMEHATSKGGFTTVEELLIHKGYWRATNTSTNILRCFNTKACQGGRTGASDYCALGYEGPYCSICSKNYFSTLRFTCRECSDRTAVIATVAVLLALTLVVVIAIASYLVSMKVVGDGRGIVDHVMERVPLQSVKIIITVWQILTQFTFVANVNFPSVYQKFLDGVNFLNFDISWVLSTGCLVEVDFHDRLLWTTISPLVIMGLLGLTYAISLRRSLGSSETSIRNTQHKHVSIALLVTFLVYSSVSSVVFQMFACEDLDDGKRYLRADYTIECDSSKHRVLQMYSGFMIMLYPVGIPALYASLLFRNSELLGDDHALEESPVIRSISNLWKPYKPQRFYYEVIECARRISLTGVIVFIYPNSAAQVAVTFAIAVVFIFVSEGMAPYESPWDAWMSRMSQVIIFASMYLALLLKVNISGENDASQNMFEVILVACHGCMVLAVIVQIIIMTLSLRAERLQEDPRPRPRPPSNSSLPIQP